MTDLLSSLSSLTSGDPTSLIDHVEFESILTPVFSWTPAAPAPAPAPGAPAAAPAAAGPSISSFLQPTLRVFLKGSDTPIVIAPGGQPNPATRALYGAAAIGGVSALTYFLTSYKTPAKIGGAVAALLAVYGLMGAGQAVAQDTTTTS